MPEAAVNEPGQLLPNLLPEGRDVSRLTCTVHQSLGSIVTDTLVKLGAHTVLVENARSVRQRVRARPWFFPGDSVDFEGVPTEIFRTTVTRESVSTVVEALCEALQLQNPGRGSVYVQDLVEYSEMPVPEIQAATEGDLQYTFGDLVLLTGILSRAGGGETLARSALKLGACVPVVTRGTGTGIRDQLGLLRITIPPEKEFVHLMVSAHDAVGIQRLLVEEARMDRPGGGFLYQTPIRMGVLDPLLRIGRQQHAASMEQLIAAMDELKHGTHWRKRFADVDDKRGATPRSSRQNHREVTFICSEGHADAYVRAALDVWPGGATTARLRCLSASVTEGGMGARERGVLCMPTGRLEDVLTVLFAAAAKLKDALFRVQVLDAPRVFSHQKR